jgi:hypothetical protein
LTTDPVCTFWRYLFSLLGAEPQVLSCLNHSSVTRPTTLSYYRD